MSLTIEARLEGIAQGRHWVTAQAALSGATPRHLATITLLASEVISNAVLHGPPGGAIAVRAVAADGVFRVEVDDEGTAVPEVHRPEPDHFGGRGVLLIDTFAMRWGCDVHGRAGKTVWFECWL